MNWENIFLKKQSGKEILLGNNAIIRAALEAGVQFVSTYPGTPTSEIGDGFSLLKKADKGSFYFEYSINEKVALEAGIGASFSNLKTLVAMKNFGLNVASDALLPFVYTGTRGPTVIVVADDPSCHSSGQEEENTRGFASLAHIPILEPSDSQECKDFTKIAFNLSEKFEIPVILRLTTRVAHQSSIVKLGKIEKADRKVGFKKDYKKFVTMPPRVLEMHQELLDKISKIRKESEQSAINLIDDSSVSAKIGIITSGVSYLHTKEALQSLNLKIPILKLGFFHPLPENKISKFIRPLERVLIIEELDPYLEKEIKILAKDVNPKLEIMGKGLLPEVGELKPEQVMEAIAKVAEKKYQAPKIKLPVSIKRFPNLCPGCPYWSVFNGVKQAIKESGLKNEDIVFGGGIGCYMLASFAPHNIQDYLLCMGSSIGIAHGIKKADKKQKLISFVGDSSFFHAGIPALINVVHNQSNPLIILMDNQITAMTGQQPYPGIAESGRKEKGQKVKLEEIVRACGVKYLKIIEPAEDYKNFVKTVKEFIKKETVAVIIVRRPCIRIKR
ncbi:indolepyruvate ferredoxin oxidoreductase subunit alpha [Patescibacteria group bacterium]|nr:indolepyruvate ferredoxin oxidoreductase subunit alpha [Patescibacteria group bacterium]MBU4162317.1 indolepyruvate ferredoxin oxidoreductase subunit alpha [Patescibacteria group bacterium]